MTIREAGKGVVVGDTGTQTYRIGFNGGDETELEAKNMSDLDGLEEELQEIRGIGGAKARAVSEVVREFLERKAAGENEAGS